VLRLFGAILVVGGAYFAHESYQAMQQLHAISPEDSIRLTESVAALLTGLLTIACGEVIGVLFAIEKNTRRQAAES
jgi:hypothetical protein